MMSRGDQADNLRRMVREMRPHARVLAVTSGKGGVGKTNVAANLAIALSRSHRQQVVLIDADLGLANVDLMLGLQPQWNLSHVLSGERRLEDIIVPGPEGIEIVPGASGLSRLADLQDSQRRTLLEELSKLDNRSEYCIIDTGAGIGRTVISLAASADECLVVTTPEPPSVADAYAMLKIISRQPHRPQLRLLVNMVGSRQEARRVYERIAGVARKFLGLQVHDAGYIFCDGHVARAVRGRKPFVTAFPNSQAAWCLRQVAEKTLRPGHQGSDAEDVGKGFFKRVAGLFGAVT
ncbi:MAG: MinD/ParA family protein [Planctomycetes bacterium]|nr:MinD/ParA family protein [Planctomycetota bacterium]